MTEETHLNDVFDMAIQIERDARAFYAAAAENATFADAGHLLHEMATMEVGNELVFSAIKSRHQDEASVDSSDLSHSISTARFLASGIQEDLASRFTGWESCEQILNLAIGFERDTIIFLVNMKHMLADPADQASIDELILEEMGHVIKLSAHLAKLTLPETQGDQPFSGPTMWGQAGGIS